MDDHYGITDMYGMNDPIERVIRKAVPDGSPRSVVAALGANGYVAVPEPLLRELVDAWTNGGNITRCDNAAQALVAAVVEAVGPTREDTK
jgi:hypothetical protein